jgi:protocatechuate 3,4-dioxygenase beta subunit
MNLFNLKQPSRRIFLVTSAFAGAGAVFGASLSLAQAPLPPTPACGANDPPTPRQTEGPFFKRRSPERTSLIEPGINGRAIEISGFVLTRACKPVARALLDFWQADADGAYDNRGFRLRGHQFTDAAGRYRLVTIVPAQYPGRTAHIHVKVQAPGGPVLATQLYFPGEQQNRSDGLFRKELLVRVEREGERLTGRFDFILDIG